jgi:hypothetical protein
MYVVGFGINKFSYLHYVTSIRDDIPFEVFAVEYYYFVANGEDASVNVIAEYFHGV